MLNRRTLLTSGSAFLIGVASTPAFAADGRTGKFKGVNGHVTKGHAKLVTKNGKSHVELQGDFWFDGAPDPKVALGRNGYDSSTLMGLLKSNSGAQSFAVPAGVDVSSVNEIWIWCEKFNVGLGVAKLN